MRRRGFGEDGCVFCCGPSLGRGLGLVLAVVKCCWCFGGWDPQQSPELGLVPDLPVLASLQGFAEAVSARTSEKAPGAGAGGFDLLPQPPSMSWEGPWFARRPHSQLF